MNEVERANRDILAALLYEYSLDDSSFQDLADLNEKYHLFIDKILVKSSIAPFAGWLVVAQSPEGTSAIIRDDSYANVYGRILSYLGATVLRISWENKEVRSDKPPLDNFPVPDGWRWTLLDGSIVTPDPNIYDSALWTGVRAQTITVANKDKIKEALEKASRLVGQQGLSNEHRDQALTYLKVASDLVEVAEPPADIIWTLVERAGAIAGIVGLLLTLFLI